MSNTMTSKPKVSVLMITYNHEKFIEQAVRSVMMQETDFDYELVIGEDCSTDRTREIVLRLKEEFPDKIRLLLHPKNVGMIRNFVQVHNTITSQYIAWLEGDDYWISPNKLQTQVSFMDNHPDCSISFHDCVFVDVENRQIGEQRYNQDRWSLSQLLANDFIVNASAIVKNRQKMLPIWMSNLRSGLDWPYYTWILLDGGLILKYSDELLASYRMHPGGVTSAMRDKSLIGRNARKERLLLGIEDIKLVRDNLPWYLRRHLNNRLYLRNLYLTRLEIQQGCYSRARGYYWQSLLNFDPLKNPSYIRKSIKLFLHLYAGVLTPERVLY